eukprot:gnl/TRDRNA2_/TRDRNA2_160630_c0_seq1.p1 gnl/TRDRNA2_/TRDRNA2_160630_c0~~gnl/TRDRNA2_/TRDRNA2_160630_c0_seq1.p1  ORF type:complete len:254 (+),score=31.04 gnl/TRDRNA2_/TRDRNA2_160630_c0_seq1:78-839(+)
MQIQLSSDVARSCAPWAARATRSITIAIAALLLGCAALSLLSRTSHFDRVLSSLPVRRADLRQVAVGHYAMVAPAKPRPNVPLGVAAKGRFGSAAGTMNRLRLPVGLDRAEAQNQWSGIARAKGKSDDDDKPMAEWYEVHDVAPPAKTLGLHLLPYNTQSGDWIIVGERQSLAGKKPFDNLVDAMKRVEANSDGELEDREGESRYIVKRVRSRYKLRGRKFVPLGFKTVDVQQRERYYAEGKNRDDDPKGRQK